MSSDSSAADLIAELQSATVPLPNILRHLAKEMRTTGWSRGLERLAELVEQGVPLAVALDDTEVIKQLPTHLRNLFKLQYTEGLLAASLELAEIQWQTDLQRERVLRSLSYPLLALLLATATSTFLAWIVIHYIEPMVRDFGLEVTSKMEWIYWSCHVGVGLICYGAPMIGGAILLLWMFGGTRLLLSLLAEVPLLGPALRWSSVAQMLQVTAIAVDQRQNLPTAVQCGGESQADIFVADACRQLAADLERGEPFAVAWHSRRLLPEILVPFWQAAEATNAPVPLFRAAAELLTGRAQRRSELLSAILPPFVFIGIGIVITVLIYAVIWPTMAIIDTLSWNPRSATNGVDMQILKLTILAIPAVAMFISLRILYGAERYRLDSFRRTFVTVAWGLLIISIVGFLVGVFTIASGWMIPVTIVVLLGVWIRFRRSEDRSLLDAFALAMERHVPLIDVALGFAGEGNRRTAIVATALANGLPLSKALHKGGIALPPGARAALIIGEARPDLAPLLKNSLLPLRPCEENLSNVMRRMVIWLFVLAIAMLLLTFVGIYIVPVMGKMWQEFGLRGPEPTMATYRFFSMNGTLWAFIIAVCLPGTMLLATLHQVGVPLRIFPFSWFRRRYDTAVLLRLMADGTRAQLSLVQIAKLLSQSYDVGAVRRRLQRALAMADAGGDFWEAFGRYGLIKSSEKVALQAADRVGNLPTVLETMSDSILRRLEFRLHVCANLIHTVGLIISTGAVIVAVIWVFVPLIGLINGLSGK